MHSQYPERPHRPQRNLVRNRNPLANQVAVELINFCSGYGTEKENLAAEKAFEEAEAKGLRPCAYYLLRAYHTNILFILIM